MAQHVEPVSGDEIIVKIGTVGGVLQEVVLNGDRTVGRVKEIAGYPSSAEVRIHGEKFENDDNVEEGDILMIIASEEDRPKGAC